MNEPKNYVWNASDYSKNSVNQYKWAQELIPKLKLKGNEGLLDIGCGDGKITAEISKILPSGRVVGIDSSKEMINLSKKTFPHNVYSNLSFEWIDAQKLTFKEEFDVAFSNAALHWIPDQKKVLSGIERSLKKGGRLLFQMAGKGNAKAILELIDEIVSFEPWNNYFNIMKFPYGFFDIDEYAKFLRDSGLKPMRLELFPKDMKFNGKEGLAGWVRTTWLPYIEKVPERERDSFVEEIVERYLRKYPVDENDTVHVGMVRLEVEAQKL